MGTGYGHIIVCGLDGVGLLTVEQLHLAGVPTVVIDDDADPRLLHVVRGWQVPVVHGSSRRLATLAEAGLAGAAAVPVVLRLFDRKLATTVQRSFGLGLVRSTAALAAPWFVGAALGLDVLATFYAEHQLMLVGRLTVAGAGGLDGLAMQDLSARTRVVAISRAAAGGALEYPPRRDTRFHAGDRAYLIGPYEELLQVLRRDALSPTQVPTV
jgi:hypothetical protein